MTFGSAGYFYCSIEVRKPPRNSACTHVMSDWNARQVACLVYFIHVQKRSALGLDSSGVHHFGGPHP